MIGIDSDAPEHAIGPASFHVPSPGPYLLTHSVGCLPRSTIFATQTQYFEPWIQSGGDAWSAWLAQIDEFRSALSTLLGGRHSDYCPQTNVSSALAKLLPSLQRRNAKRSVLIAAEDTFPSIGFVLQQARAWGLELRLIPRSSDPATLQSWVDALGPDVLAALITQVHSNTGVITPVSDIAQHCKANEVISIVDITQSAGIVPLSVENLCADAIIGSCVKWLCGGPGAGFLWLRGELTEQLEPVDVGWFSHADPFEMDIHSFRYANDARRFWGGTPSVVPYISATQGLRLLSKLGISQVWDYNRSLIRAFLEYAPSSIRESVNLDRIGGTLCLSTGQRGNAVRAALESIQARFDTRGETLRLSFHLCNTVDQARLIGQKWPR